MNEYGWLHTLSRANLLQWVLDTSNAKQMINVAAEEYKQLKYSDPIFQQQLEYLCSKNDAIDNELNKMRLSDILLARSHSDEMSTLLLQVGRYELELRAVMLRVGEINLEIPHILLSRTYTYKFEKRQDPESFSDQSVLYDMSGPGINGEILVTRAGICHGNLYINTDRPLAKDKIVQDMNFFLRRIFGL